MNKIYVDGCSYTYGLGLDRKFSLANLLGATVDLSRPGKSNVAMIQDLHANILDYDIFVIGFTFSSRYLFSYNDVAIDMHASSSDIYLGDDPNAQSHEHEYQKLHSLFYKFSTIESFNQRSDFMIDAALALLQQQSKTAVIFSWEPRDLVNHDRVFYPRKLISSNFNQSKTNWHLTAQGMEILANLVKEKYEK
jgi:hypothetical protein